MVFIGGLHRSGTSILHRVISSSEAVSGFSNTGVPEDEGQHLQTVFKAANKFGGPGKFAFNTDAGLDENSPLVSTANRDKLITEWTPLWDAEKPVWVEKSPPNLIRTRFFQALFPDALFITLFRHPLAVALATQKWSKTSVHELLKHWIKAHQIYLQDKPHLNHVLEFSYEHMTQQPEAIIKALEAFVDIKIDYHGSFINMNGKYLDKWRTLKSWQWLRKREQEKCIRDYEEQLNEFGYSLVDLDRFPLAF